MRGRGRILSPMAAAKKDTDSQILLYQAPDGQTRLEVNLEQETVWLSLAQMATLFDRDKSVISRHLRNIFESGELSKKATVAFFATVQNEGQRQVERQVEYFNLDAIISVGYRVNSIRGTQFRIWATHVLREHLVQGYTLNERRLQAQQARINELKRAIGLITRVAENKSLSSDEAAGLIRVIGDYSYGLDLIDAYDYQRLDITAVSTKKTVPVSYADAKKAIEQLRLQYKASDLFGREKDQSFEGSLVGIFQTFDKKQLYPSIEEKAANLLYFLVKNHPFVDGNKRIAAFIFLWFLDRNARLYHRDGSKRLADNALVALTLMVAESDPREKDIIVKVIINLINEKN